MIEAYAAAPERGQASQLTGWIYALVDPRDHAIFYVGQTRDLDMRKRAHFAGGHSISGAMIRVIRSNGLLPLVVVLEADVPLRRLGIAEAFWIALLRRRGCGLLNVPPQADARRQLRDSVRSIGFGAPRIASSHVPENNSPLSLNEREQRRQQRVREQGLPVNTGKPWTSGEEAVLQALFRRGLRADDIARRFGRSRDAVAARLMRLGLVGGLRSPTP